MDVTFWIGFGFGVAFCVVLFLVFLGGWYGGMTDGRK